ncbi:hypothetical protein BMETH_221011121987, partial [methanotrophic bacterial endosymbiont of Bathymodiolus sp.]
VDHWSEEKTVADDSVIPLLIPQLSRYSAALPVTQNN